MATNNLQANVASPFAGLGTSTYNVLAAGSFVVDCQMTLPANNGLGNSAVQIVINKNGSAVVTVGGATADPTPSQPSIGARANILCAASDVLTVVISSAAVVDNLANSVKSMINLYPSDGH